jgi:hypothetical protein
LEQHAENPVPWLVFEPFREPALDPVPKREGDSASVSTPAATPDSTEQLKLNEEVSISQESPVRVWLDDTGIQIIRATRTWIQYGTVGFAVVCIVIGAVEGLFGR